MKPQSSPIVEVQGTWLENLGARQLLDATVHGLRAERADVAVAIDPRWGKFACRAELGLLQVVPREMPGRATIERALDMGYGLAPRVFGRALDDYGLVRRRDVAGLVDASGFALSDQWGPGKAEQRWQVVERYARRGRPVVLLPQALGPFSDPETARFARRILSAADRVWVRDHCSLGHARELVGDRPSIKIAPDLTVLEPGLAPASDVADVVLVPNGRLIDHGGWARAEYVTALSDAARTARADGCSLEILLHTSEYSDQALGAELADALGCPVVQERDPRMVKGRLGAAQLVVGSRFHALLGALSQGVPAVAIGWSHKYDELFADFGIAELARPERVAGAAASTVARALADLPEFGARIATRLPTLRAAVETMWTECREVLALSESRGAARVR